MAVSEGLFEVPTGAHCRPRCAEHCRATAVLGCDCSAVLLHGRAAPSPPPLHTTHPPPPPALPCQVGHARLIRLLGLLCPRALISGLRAPLERRLAEFAQPAGAHEKAEQSTVAEVGGWAWLCMSRRGRWFHGRGGACCEVCGAAEGAAVSATAWCARVGCASQRLVVHTALPPREPLRNSHMLPLPPFCPTPADPGGSAGSRRALPGAQRRRLSSC